MKKILISLFIAFIILLPFNYSKAAIAYDAFSSWYSWPGSSTTWSHTVSGSDTILFVGFHILSTSDLATGVTFNGDALTRINTQVGSSERAYLYYMVAPDDGAHNIVVSFSSSIENQTAAASYTGAAQSGQPDANNTGSGANPLNISVTTVADNAWPVIFARNTGANVTAESGTTFRGGANSLNMGDSNADITPAGSTSLGFNQAAGENIGCMASFAPPAPPAPLDDAGSQEPVWFD